MSIREEIRLIDAYRCESCEVLSSEYSDEPLYQCGGCEAYGEEGERCYDCKRKLKKVADESCVECGVGPIEAVIGYHCDRCGENVDSESLSDHIAECFTDDVAEEAAGYVLAEAVRVEAIQCPACERLFLDSGQFAEHIDEDGCDVINDEKQRVIDDEIVAIEKEAFIAPRGKPVDFPPGTFEALAKLPQPPPDDESIPSPAAIECEDHLPPLSVLETKP